MLLCCCVPLLIGSLTGLYYAASTLEERQSSSLAAVGEQLVQYVEMRMKQLEPISGMLSQMMYRHDHSIDKPLSQYLDIYFEISAYIDAVLTNFKLFNIEVFCDSNALASQNNLRFFPLDRLGEYGMQIETLEKSSSNPILQAQREQRFPIMISKEARSVMHYWQACYNTDNRAISSAYAITIDCDDFIGQLRIAYPQDDINGYLILADGTVFAGDTDGPLPLQADAELLDAVKNGRSGFQWNDQFVYILPAYSDQIYLITAVSNHYLASFRFETLLPFALGIIIAICATVILAVKLSNRASRRIELLNAAMTLNESEYSEESIALLKDMNTGKDADRDEIYYLTNKFRTMLIQREKNYNLLVDTIWEKEQLKYRLFRDRIKPHFLYNILNSIRITNMIGKHDDTNQMLYDLALFYQQILRKDEMISIADDVKIAEHYLCLEAKCHSKRIEWKFDIDHDLESQIIPKFTLQPIIENCVKHGVSMNKDCLLITVRVQCDQNALHLSIADNGRGIAKDALDRVRQSLTNQSASAYHHGLGHTVEMLKIYYQEKADLTIESEIEAGTTVKLTIPYGAAGGGTKTDENGLDC